MNKSQSGISCRGAKPAEIDQLVELEQQCFETDRISRRQFVYLLNRANAIILVAIKNNQLAGDVVILFNRVTSTARIYSIATAPYARGQGIARELLLAAESAAWDKHRAWVRMEVRKDNVASIRLFESLGYHRFGEHKRYYADNTDAWRYEKTLRPNSHLNLLPISYYRQSL